MGSAPSRSKQPHLLFQVCARKPKTVVVAVIERRASDTVLGEIAWFGPFRAYCFMPYADTIWSNGCLAEVRAEIARLMADHRARKEPR